MIMIINVKHNDCLTADFAITIGSQHGGSRDIPVIRRLESHCCVAVCVAWDCRAMRRGRAIFSHKKLDIAQRNRIFQAVEKVR